MREITLKDFRCFHEKQTARLAPLTLLVGENSTGKTSFMAMIRALREVADPYGIRPIPDWKEGPYDLGSFDEIAHYRGGRGGRAETFEAGFADTHPTGGHGASDDGPHEFAVTFGKDGTIPVPVRRRFTRGSTWFEERFVAGGPYVLEAGTVRGKWKTEITGVSSVRSSLEDLVPPPFYLLRASDPDLTPVDGSPAITRRDRQLLSEIVRPWHGRVRQGLFAGAPVRSAPRRTYDPSRPTRDPEGDYVPMYLASLSFQQGKQRWEVLRQQLEDFGRSAGLFDDISIRPLGKRDSEPFQLQVRKLGVRRRGPQRNLIDVGYGVSQVLPVITELLRPDAPAMFLLQQPEVHLHPSAQAALGNLFCRVASAGGQLVIETHSDHLLDRVRMDVRDGTSGLKPNDVSILFFERADLDVNIHSLRIDEEGNIVGAPDGYRRFFMEELQRSLGL